MREMLDRLCDEYIEVSCMSPNRLRCDFGTSLRLKASPDLAFNFLPTGNVDIKTFVNGLLLEVDNEIAPDIIIVDRV